MAIAIIPICKIDSLKMFLFDPQKNKNLHFIYKTRKNNDKIKIKNKLNNLIMKNLK